MLWTASSERHKIPRETNASDMLAPLGGLSLSAGSSLPPSRITPVLSTMRPQKTVSESAYLDRLMRLSKEIWKGDNRNADTNHCRRTSLAYPSVLWNKRRHRRESAARQKWGLVRRSAKRRATKKCPRKGVCKRQIAAMHTPSHLKHSRRAGRTIK